MRNSRATSNRVMQALVVTTMVSIGAAWSQTPERKPTDDDGIVDPLEAMVWGVESTPVKRDWSGPARGRFTAGPAQVETSDVTGLRYPWVKSLSDVLTKAIAGEIIPVEAPWTPTFNFFPSAGENTFFWVNVPLVAPLPEGTRLVGYMRAKEGGLDQSYALGTEKIPFTIKPSTGAFVAQAARDLPPGPYAIALATVDAAGKEALHYVGDQRVARMPQESLRISSPIFADGLTPKETATAGPFQTSGFEVIPRTNTEFKPGEALKVFFVVLGASSGPDGKTNLEVTYQLNLKAKGAPAWQKAGKPQVLSNRTGAAQAWELMIAPAFPAAEYKLEIKVKDNLTGGIVTSEPMFTVVK